MNNNIIKIILNHFEQNKTDISRMMLYKDSELFNLISELALLVAQRNSVYPEEHPTDSLYMTFNNYEQTCDICLGHDVEDAHLKGFLIPSVFAVCLLMFELQEKQYTYNEALQLLVDNGIFDYLAAYGRSAGASDYYDTVDEIHRFFNPAIM